MKLRFLLFLLLPIGAMAQTTSVTLNVTDGDGTAWAFGTYSITLTNPPGVNGPPFNLVGTTTAVTPQSVAGQLNSGGGASGIILTSNTSIAPIGTVWQFTVCPTATAVCYTQQVSITGPTQSVNLTPPAIRINLSAIPFRVTAYSDIEINNAIYGNLYYNVTEPSLRVCTGQANGACTWSDVSASTGLNCGTPGQAGIPIWNGTACVIDTNLIDDGNGNLTANSVTANTLATSGNGGVIDFQLQAPPTSVPSGHLQFFASNVTNALACLNSSLSSCFGATQTIASGTATMGTSAITSGGCATVVTVTATGTATTDKIGVSPNVDPTGVTGYGPSASGSLYIQAWPTANAVNFKVCNNTGGSITPAALTLNWGVFR